MDFDPAAAAAAVLTREPEQLSLFEGGVDLSALRKERAELAGRQRSEGTRVAYAADWRDFAAWCLAAGRPPLPASSDTVSLYLVSLARPPRSLAMATLARRLSAIASAHLVAGLASPCGADVWEVLSGCRRRFGRPRECKEALSVGDLRRVLAACGDGARGARDRALLLLGFASACRRSEIAAFDLADVRFTDVGMLLQIRRSKTDQLFEGQEVGVHFGKRPGTCAVAAVRGWLVERGSWPGALFCRVHPRTGVVRRVRIRGWTVCDVLKRSAAAAGLDPAVYGAHSLRAGCATAASANDAPDLAIMRRTRHRSIEVLRDYIRHGKAFGPDPLDDVL
jgi:integrase